MKKEGYIERVLSHIRGTYNHNEIRLELQDHIDEKSKYFSDIGYDDESSYNNAELAMGYADVVGEQLDLNFNDLRKNRVYYYILDFFAVVFGALSFLFNYGFYYYDDFYSQPRICLSSFWLLLLTSTSLCLCLVCLIVATKRKRLTSLFVGTICAIVSTLFFASCLGNVIVSAVNGQGIAAPFYYGIDETFTICKALKWILFLFLACVFFSDLVVYIKTRRFENTRQDIIKSKAFYVILAVFSALVLIFTLIMSVHTIAIKSEMINESTEYSVKAGRALVENISSFMTTDRDELANSAENVFTDIPYDDNFLYTDVIENDSKHTFAGISYDQWSSEIDIYISESIFDPFAFNKDDIYLDYLYNLKAEDVFKGMDISDAPLPAEIHFSYNTDYCRLLFNYNVSNYSAYVYTSDSFILFEYDFENECFELVDSSVFDYSNSLTITDKQQKQLDASIYDYLSLNCFDVNMNICSNIYDVNYCDSCTADKIYKIDMSYCLFDVMLYNGKLMRTKISLTEPVTVIAKYRNNKFVVIEIIDYIEEEDMLKSIFTEKAKNAFLNRGKWYDKPLSESDNLVYKENIGDADFKTLKAYLEREVEDKSTLPEYVRAFEGMCKKSLNLDDDVTFCEYGTFDFTGRDMFYFSLVRQCSNYNGEYYQLHMDIMFEPNDTNKSISGTEWSDNILDDFFNYITSTNEYKLIENDKIVDVCIYVDET